MLPTREALLAKAASLPSNPVAFEAFWDGDTYGWFVVLVALYAEIWSYGERDISVLQGDVGNMRLFNGVAPPWPEAALAQEIAGELAKIYSVEFFFPSPKQPEDGCPRWWDRKKATASVHGWNVWDPDPMSLLAG